MNREEILIFLQRKQARREKLQDKFFSVINSIIPSKPAPLSSGYTETKITLVPSKKQKLRFHQLLYELKRDGLMVEENNKGELLYRVTANGLRWLEKFRQHSHASLPIYSSPATSHSAVTIVSYDIPEKSKYLREWIRSSLRNLGLKPMQRSIFIGKIKLPEQFLKDLVIFKLEKHVEIFEITKAGTLRHRI